MLPTSQSKLVYRTGFGAGTDLPAMIEALIDLIVQSGHCDRRTVERGRRVAAENGQRLDVVLLQLGLISERGLAESYAALLDLPIATTDRYPETPLLADTLQARFLRSARILPLSMNEKYIDLAMVDPLDRFAALAAGAATSRAIAIKVAVPLELEAAFERLYPNPIADQDVKPETVAASSSAGRCPMPPWRRRSFER